ncbi:MAG: YqaA family protein [Deltaproteobacteria bacterium]
MSAVALEFLKQHGIWGLIFTAFAESSFLPVAPDIFLVPLALALPKRAFVLALICTLCSCAGSLFGYFLGDRIGHPLLKKVTSPATMDKLEMVVNKYGAWAIFVAALTPIPYKVFTICSGVFSMNIPRFLLAALLGRGVRFFTEAILIYTMGQQAIRFVQANYGWISLAIVIIVVLAYLAVRYVPSVEVENEA